MRNKSLENLSKFQANCGFTEHRYYYRNDDFVSPFEKENKLFQIIFLKTILISVAHIKY